MVPRHKNFLRGFKRLEPDWTLLPLPHVRELPGVTWKLQNLKKLKGEQPERYKTAVDTLEDALENFQA